MALTRESLRTDLRDLIGEYTSVNPATDTRLNRFLNKAIRNLAKKVREFHPEYYETSGSISAVADTYLYDLPSTWIATQRIENEDGDPVTYSPTNVFADPANQTRDPADYFGIYGPQIWLYPTPSADHTYTHFYTTMPTDMSADSGTPDFPPGFDEVIVSQAAVFFEYAAGASVGDMGPLYMELNTGILELKNYDWQQCAPRRVAIGDGFFGALWPNTHGAT